MREDPPPVSPPLPPRRASASPQDPRNAAALDNLYSLLVIKDGRLIAEHYH